MKEVYIGPIITARYHVGESPKSLKCTNSLCRRDIPSPDARFCAYCGREFKPTTARNPSVLNPPETPGFHQLDGPSCHRFIVADQQFYHDSEGGVVIISEVVSSKDLRIPVDVIKAIAAVGYDSVEISFGLVLTEYDDDDGCDWHDY